MAKNPWEFLRGWKEQHVNATAFHDRPTAKRLADECLHDATLEGFSEDAVIKAAGGNLTEHILGELDSAANREVARQAENDKF